MPFECPGCKTGSLEITRSLEVPPGPDDDEMSVQLLHCSGCGFDGLAVYREDRRGGLDSESWTHDGYQINDSALQLLRKAIESCPARASRSCPCAGHARLKQYDWPAMAGNGLEVVMRFTMRQTQNSPRSRGVTEDNSE